MEIFHCDSCSYQETEDDYCSTQTRLHYLYKKSDRGVVHRCDSCSQNLDDESKHSGVEPTALDIQLISLIGKVREAYRESNDKRYTEAYELLTQVQVVLLRRSHA